jgi:hypothetical protein
MRQLTALDALFLAAEENDRIQGHGSVLGVYDPANASGRPLDAALIRELVTERTPCPAAVAAGRCSASTTVLGRRGTIDVDYHICAICLLRASRQLVSRSPASGPALTSKRTPAM